MKEPKIYIAGHRGMVGAAVLDTFRNRGYKNLVTKTSRELDLRNQRAVEHFIHLESPDVVILAAARVGGILANDQYPYKFLHVQDLTDAVFFAFEQKLGEGMYNIGSGEDLPIGELAKLYSKSQDTRETYNGIAPSLMGHPANCWMSQN